MWRNRQFQRLVFADVTSSFGDWMMIAVMPVWMLKMTGSVSASSWLLFAGSTPAVLSRIAGSFIDRFGFRKGLVWFNLGSAVVFSAAAALVAGSSEAPILYAVSVLSGVGQVLIAPAMSIAMTEAVGAGDLDRANGVLTGATQSLRVIGPAIGTGLFVLTGSGQMVCALNAASFAAAAVIFRKGFSSENRVAQAGSEKEPLNMQRAAFDPVSRTVIRVLLVAGCLFGLSAGMFGALTIEVQQRFELGETFYGYTIIGGGVGAAIVGICLSIGLLRTSGLKGLLIGIVCYLVGLATFITGSRDVILAGSVIKGAGSVLIVVSIVSTAQRITPRPLLGRTSGSLNLTINGGQAVAAAAAASAVTVIDFHVLVAIMAALLFGALFIALPTRSIAVVAANATRS